MKMKKILFATDFSHAGDAAFVLATSLARDSGARLLIVHVQEPPVAYGDGERYYGVPEPDLDEIRAMLERIRPEDADVEFEHHLIEGDPAAALSTFAKDQATDLIVLGTHGRTGLMRLLMGSVAEAVVRRAPCPVLTFRQPDAEAKHDEIMERDSR
jgi:nucleotide-binding universal stress UspA family protein